MVVQLAGQLWVARGEDGEGGDHEALGRGLEGPHAQAPRDRVGLLQGGLGRLEPFEHPAPVPGEQPAGVREQHAAPDAFEQLPARLGLESRELLRHRRGRVVERRRHGGDGSALLELYEKPQPARVKHSEILKDKAQIVELF